MGDLVRLPRNNLPRRGAKAVIYVRLPEGREADLPAEVNRMTCFARKMGLAVDKVFQEVCSGSLYERRLELVRTLDRLKRPDVGYLIVSNPEQVLRGGKDEVLRYCERYNVQLLWCD